MVIEVYCKNELIHKDATKPLYTYNEETFETMWFEAPKILIRQAILFNIKYIHEGMWIIKIT